jgi:hypothetical protein
MKLLDYMVKTTLTLAMCNLPFRGRDESLHSENQGIFPLLFFAFEVWSHYGKNCWISSLLSHPQQLWDQTSHLSSGCQGPLTQVKEEGKVAMVGGLPLTST